MENAFQREQDQLQKLRRRIDSCGCGSVEENRLQALSAELIRDAQDALSEHHLSRAHRLIEQAEMVVKRCEQETVRAGRY